VAEPAALIVDYGGVLTAPLADTMAQWCAADGIDVAVFRRVMRDWLGPAYAGRGPGNPLHALERGELPAAEFEVELALRLRGVDGGAVAAAGLLERMFAGFETGEAPMRTAVGRARSAGVLTGLLSNSWGLDYPRVGWDELFDVVVISGEVGLRKPEPEIYALAARRLGVDPGTCVFVDDLSPNVRGAEAAGMVGVHHVDAEQTLRELEALFGLTLR
jgi:putative hydrolase of the HAD superfamily